MPSEIPLWIELYGRKSPLDAGEILIWVEFTFNDFVRLKLCPRLIEDQTLPNNEWFL